jgi:aquaporin rerated protein, other eukaryote
VPVVKLGPDTGLCFRAFFRIEGGMFNPAVAIAMFVTGGFGPLRLGLVIVAQLLGSIAASALVVGLLPGDGIAATTGLAGDTSVVRGLFIEAFLTAELVFVIFMLATEKHRATAVAPVGVGLALFICELMCVSSSFAVNFQLTSTPGAFVTPAAA